jgi:hypothetical protein
MMDFESQNQDDFNFVEDQNAEILKEKYEVPVLYRSRKAGSKYRLSEILVPRAKEVIEANLRFNAEHMQNKLLKLSHNSTKEAKKKVEECLADRNKILMKTIREGSMRLLLKEYLYFKSDLSKRYL